MPTAQQANQHRAEVAALASMAASELAPVWSEFDTAEAARDGLLDLLPQLVLLYGAAAATLGADFYDDVRDTDGVGGGFRAITAELDDMGAESLARWGVDPLFQPEPDWGRAQVLIEGGVQERIANADRASITGSALADPQALGWQRAGQGECAFCAMLISRGAVYTEAGVTFGAHENCNCTALPAWGGQELPVKPYTPSNRNITDADRARVREWIRANT